MKKIYTFVAASLFTALTGCSGFLDQELKSDVPGAESYETEAGF